MYGLAASAVCGVGGMFGLESLLDTHDGIEELKQGITACAPELPAEHGVKAREAPDACADFDDEVLLPVEQPRTVAGFKPEDEEYTLQTREWFMREQNDHVASREGSKRLTIPLAGVLAASVSFVVMYEIARGDDVD